MKRFENIGLLMVLAVLFAVLVASGFVGIADYGIEGWGSMVWVLLVILAATLVDRGYAAWKWWERGRYQRGLLKKAASDYGLDNLGRVNEVLADMANAEDITAIRTRLQVKMWRDIVAGNGRPVVAPAVAGLRINQPHWGDLVGGDVAPMALGERISVAAAGAVACGCRQLFDDQWTKERGAIRHVHFGDRGGIMVIKIREMRT